MKKQRTGYGKRILVSVLAAAMLVTGMDTTAFLDVEAAVSGLPGARSVSDADGNVFLGGNYIEVGVSKHGSFGTSLRPSDNVTNGSYTEKAFHASTAYEGLGLQSDQDGWNVGAEPITGDFFLPGTPEERWILQYSIDGTVYTYCVADRMATSMSSWSVEPLATNTSTGDQLSARIYGVTNMGVAVTIDYTFGVDDMEYKTNVSVENRSGKNISDVRFVRSFDPDQDQQKYGDFETYNKVICNPDSTRTAGADNYAMVVARGTHSLGGFFFLAVDNRARASHGVAFSPSNASFPGFWDAAEVTAKTYADDADVEMTTDNLNGYTKEDNAIAITFNLGTMEAGKSDALEYYSSLDPNVTASLDKLKKTLGLNIDFSGETINGFDGAGTYDITRTEDGKTWKLVIGEDKNYILYDDTNTQVDSGIYDEDASLGIKLIDDWYGSTLTIQKQAQGDTTYEPADITIPARPEAPDDPNVPNADNSAPSEIKQSDVTTTTNSIQVKGIEGQEYTIDGGRTWKKPDASGNVSFEGLTEGTEYQVQTRVSATSSSLCSYTSAGVTVKTMRMFTDIVETEYFNQEYDGASHVVKAETGVEGAVVSYSETLDGTYRTEPYSFVDAGTKTIYYKVEKDGYYTAYGDLNATIKGRALTVRINNAEKTYGEKDPKLTYTVESGLIAGHELTGITLTRTAGEAAGTYEISGTHTTLAGNVYDVTFVNSGIFTIDPKPLNVHWADTTLTYNGKPQTPDVRLEGVISGDTCEPVVDGAMTDAGEDYTATVAITNTNYTLDADETSTTFRIVNADQSKPLLSAMNETIEGKNDGGIKGLTTNMEYRRIGSGSGVDTDAAYEAVVDPDMNLSVGTYEVRYAARKNYNVSEAATVVIRSGRKLVITVPEKKNQTGYSLSSDKKEGSWLDHASIRFELAKGYSKTDTFAVKINGKAVTLDPDGAYTIADMQEDQNITVEGVADITAPEGTVTVATNVWKNLINKVTFNLFYKQAQKVSFTGTDEGSGVDSISYYLYTPSKTKTELSYADLVALKEKNWTKLTLDKNNQAQLMIDPDQKSVVYERVCDKAGNVTYVSSDGIIVDATKPVITGIKSGETYCQDKVVTIQDMTLSKVTVRVDNGKETELTLTENGKYVLDITSVLDKNSKKKLTLTAYDASGNKTAVSVYAAHIYGDGVVKKPTAVDKGYTSHTCKVCGDTYTDKETAATGVKGLDPTDKSQLEEMKKEAQKRLADKQNPPTAEEKKLYNDVLKKAESLLADVKKAEDELQKIAELDRTLPDTDSITADDSKKLAEELKKVTDLLDAKNADTPTSSLTDEQKKQLKEYKKELEEKQKRLSEVSAALDKIYNGTDKKAGSTNIPDKENVTPSDQKNIERLIGEIEDLLKENGANLTEAQKSQLRQEKEKLEEKLKEAAKKDVEAAYQESVKKINETITDETKKANALKKAEGIANTAKKEIDQASDASAVVSKRDTEKLKLNLITATTDEAKKLVEEMIDQETKAAKEALDKLTDLTPQQKKDAASKIDKQAEAAKKKLKAADSNSTIEKIYSDTKINLDVIIDNSEKQDLKNAKDAAIAKVNEKAAERKKEIDKQKGITEAEKKAAKEEIERERKLAVDLINNVTDPEKKSDVLTEQGNGVLSVSNVNADKTEKELSTARTSASDAIKKEAERLKAQIDALQNVTKEEKEAAKKKIDEEVKKALAGIEKITDPAKKGDVSKSKVTAIENILKEYQGMDKKDLTKAKDQAKRDIEAKGQEIKTVIDELENLTPEQKEALKKKIDEQVKSAKEQITKIQDVAEKSKIGAELEKLIASVDTIQTSSEEKDEAVREAEEQKRQQEEAQKKTTETEASADKTKGTSDSRKTEDTKKPEDTKLPREEYKDVAKKQVTKSTEVVYGNGSIQVKIESVDENGEKETDKAIKGVMVSSYENIINACLDEDEKSAVEAGENIEIRLTVSKEPENIPENDQTLVQQAVAKTAEEVEGFTLASFVDIQLEKRIGAAEWKKIANAKQELEITIDIPKELKVEGASYSIMRCHNGECVLLEDLDQNPDTITIRTKLFSTYAICYTAAANTAEEEKEAAVTSDTETMDDSAASAKVNDLGSTGHGKDCSMHWWILVLAVLGAALLLLLKKASASAKIVILVLDLVAALVLAILGTCNLDWIFFGIDAVVMIICFVIGIRRNQENK